jgi:hypothetical protein
MGWAAIAAESSDTETRSSSAPEMISLGWAGLGWAGLGWAGLGWAGLGWAGLGWAGLGRAAAWGSNSNQRLRVSKHGLPPRFERPEDGQIWEHFWEHNAAKPQQKRGTRRY